jgi:apolipoprotein N-acyltransferase
MSRFLPWLLALAGGLMLGLAFPPAGFGDLCWLAVAPLAWAVWFRNPFPRRGVLGAAALGYAFGLVFFSMGAFWLTTLTWAGYLLLVPYFSFYTAGWAVFLHLVERAMGSGVRQRWTGSLHNLAVCALGAAAWTATEWLRGVVFPYFGWNGLGIAQWKNIPFLQVCSITGVGGLSFVIAMANLMLAATVKRVWIEIRQGARKAHYDFALTVGLVALVWAYGVGRMLEEPPEMKEMTFAAVQAAVPQEVRNDPRMEFDVLEAYRRQTAVAIAMRPDIVLWPESATPNPLFGHEFTYNMVRDLARDHQGDFLLGTVHWGADGDYNSIVLLTSGGTEAQIHHKIHLVPFGEYVPLREEFPLLARIVGQLVPDDFDAGREFTILESVANPVRFGPLVCFEDTVGDLAREFALRGAQAFVVVTNDGWFLESAGSVQHLRNAVFRCVENGLPMIRAANTGVTCAIDRLGNVREVLQDETGSTFRSGVLFGRIEVPVDPRPTFYARYGEVFSIACLVVSMLAAGICGVLVARGKKSPCSTPPRDETSPP